MVSAKLFAVAAFVAGALAAPVSTTTKQFRIGVTFKDGKTLYLTPTTTASTNLADGVLCSLTDGKIACGANNAGLTYGDFHTMIPLEPTVVAANNKGFSIADDLRLHWAAKLAGKEVNLSTSMMGSANQLFAEICSSYGHPDAMMFTPGVAKVYYVQ